MSELKPKHYCARVVPTLEDEPKQTFPMFKKVAELDKNGDPVEKFVPMSEEEKLNLRASSVFVDVGNGRVTSPLPRDKFEVLDELYRDIDNMSEEEIEELKH